MTNTSITILGILSLLSYFVEWLFELTVKGVAGSVVLSQMVKEKAVEVWEDRDFYLLQANVLRNRIGDAFVLEPKYA